MDKITKEFEVTQEDGWWIASTPVRDRQDDRVFPMGLDITNYRKNPVMIWAHDYQSPFAVIGRAADVQVTERDLRVRPEWREPANDNDPMTIIRALIDAGLVKTLSIGFRPLAWVENDFGGYDFTQAEILEISAVPVPANQEALRLAVKSFGDPEPRVTMRSFRAKIVEVSEQVGVTQDQQALATPETNEPKPEEPKDDNTELSPEGEALSEDVIKQLSAALSELKRTMGGA